MQATINDIIFRNCNAVMNAKLDSLLSGQTMLEGTFKEPSYEIKRNFQQSNEANCITRAYTTA
jgi:hypothetical protein